MGKDVSTKQLSPPHAPVWCGLPRPQASWGTRCPQCLWITTTVKLPLVYVPGDDRATARSQHRPSTKAFTTKGGEHDVGAVPGPGHGHRLFWCCRARLPRDTGDGRLVVAGPTCQAVTDEGQKAEEITISTSSLVAVISSSVTASINASNTTVLSSPASYGTRTGPWCMRLNACACGHTPGASQAARASRGGGEPTSAWPIIQIRCAE